MNRDVPHIGQVSLLNYESKSNQPNLIDAEMEQSCVLATQPINLGETVPVQMSPL